MLELKTIIEVDAYHKNSILIIEFIDQLQNKYNGWVGNVNVNTQHSTTRTLHYTTTTTV